MLDVGCSGGLLAELLRDLGHHVTGVDCVEIPGVDERVDEFVLADLEQGIPAEVGTGYDVVIAADVLEHLRDSDALLREMGSRLSAGRPDLHLGAQLRPLVPAASAPCSASFDYDQRGILDKTHVRFFTRPQPARMVKQRRVHVRRHAR